MYPVARAFTVASGRDDVTRVLQSWQQTMLGVDESMSLSVGTKTRGRDERGGGYDLEPW